MHNDPAKPGYSSKESDNVPVDNDEDQLAQDAGSLPGLGEEVKEDS
ncbi:hypothetical protein CAPI_06885 [Corynebacterium capitovis DSM 44611]|nr:hypothetical protein [Corynebacterium capitovis]WKD57917.1 hypothetical protein CAPI_06885 [Corynebacterium capitovis DSM 44611]